MISFLNTKLYQGVHFSFAKYKKKKENQQRQKNIYSYLIIHKNQVQFSFILQKSIGSQTF